MKEPVSMVLKNLNPGVEMKEKFLMNRRKMECLGLVWKEVERQHLEVLIQRNIKSCLTIFSSLQSTFSSGHSVQQCSAAPLISSPQAAASTSNSTTLSSSQASWYNSVWASMHGSKLLLDMLREGGT